MDMDRRIAPDFSFRFSPKSITTYYKSAARAFDSGDFVIAAQSNDAADREVKACGQILSGLIDQGLGELANQEGVSGRGKLCQAYALWVLDRVAEANAILDEIVDRETAEAAAIFRGLLNREEITVFVTGAMLPVRTETTDTARQPVFRYGPITMKYVGSQLTENAYDYRLHEPMDEFIRDLPPRERPDIIFALSPQWLIPVNFEQVDVPKVLWSHDEDVFLYRNVENFALYDVAICACSQAHFELSRSAGIFCASNVIFSPLATPFPEASLPERKNVDLLFTGSGLDEFHSEKPRFIYQLTELEADYKIKLVNGHLPEEQYFDLLRHAKFLPIVNRYAGAPSPRWRDALTNGACILYPEGTLYDEIAPGCFPIRESSISADVRRHLENFDKVAPSYDLKEIVPEVNRRFAIHRESREKSFERLLKYAVFLALVWRGEGARGVCKPKRRAVWLTPLVDWSIFGVANVRERLSGFVDHLDQNSFSDALDFNNAAHLCAQMALNFGEDRRASDWMRRTERFFEDGLRAYPKSLLLHFNAAQWLMLKPTAAGDTAAVTEGALKFQELIDRLDELEFDPRGANVGFPYSSVYDPVFPTYQYGDVTTRELVLGNTPEMLDTESFKWRARDVLRGACHGYLAWAGMREETFDSTGSDGTRTHFDRALKIYPANQPLTRLCCEVLLEQCAIEEEPSAELVRRLADSYFAMVNMCPTILLTHIHRVVPILVRGGEAKAAKDLLAAWYRLDNVVYEAQPQIVERRQPRNLAVLYQFRPLLPKQLTGQVDAFLRDELASDQLTQLEQMMVVAVETNPVAIDSNAMLVACDEQIASFALELDEVRHACRERLAELEHVLAVARSAAEPGVTFSPDLLNKVCDSDDRINAKQTELLAHLTALQTTLIEYSRAEASPHRLVRRRRVSANARKLIAEFEKQHGYRLGNVSINAIRHAFLVWMRAPGEVKRLYIRKALHKIRTGQILGLAVRVQEWGSVSLWSKK